MEADEIRRLEAKVDRLTELWGEAIDRKQREEDRRLEEEYARRVEESIKRIAAQANGGAINGWNGNERRSDTVFSDKQVEWLKNFHRDQNKIIVGDAAIRGVMSHGWAFLAGAVSVAVSVFLAYFGFKK